jgi:hypothetical protein
MEMRRLVACKSGGSDNGLEILSRTARPEEKHAVETDYEIALRWNGRVWVW